jgi:hypothetical protein
VCNPVFKFLDGRREEKCSELSGSGHCSNLICCSFFTVYIKLCYRSNMFELRHIFEFVVLCCVANGLMTTTTTT